MMNKQKKKIGKYFIHLDRKIGEGDQGIVYQGQMSDNHLKIAIKVIPKDLIRYESQKAFSQQFQTMSVLKSPNIVGFSDCLQSRNNYYIVQQFCNGANLRKAIDTKGPFSEQKSINILKQICNGFIVMLREGVTHRDLKPENILMHNGIVKICDFGYSKRYTKCKSKILQSTILSAPAYKSLQILKNQSYTGKCDIWSIGIIFYEMLHKKTPWKGYTEIQLIHNVEKQKLMISYELSPHVRDFIEKTLKINQQDRLGWDQLFKHPIFQNYFANYVKMNQSFQNKFKIVLNEIKFIITSQNLSIQKLFVSKGYSKSSELTFEDFRCFLKMLDVPVSFGECKYAFDQIDIDGSQTVSIEQLQKVFIKHKIPLTSFHPDSIKQEKVQSTPAYPSLLSPLTLKLKKVVQKLSDQLILKNKQLYQYYDDLDTKKEGDLTIVEISKMLKQFDQTFTEDEIVSCFAIMDYKEDKKVTFKEFQKFFLNFADTVESKVSHMSIK